MKYGYKQASKLVMRELATQSSLARENMLEALNVPLLLGPVGAGKTNIALEAAQHFDLMYVAVNSGENSDVTDVSGVPVPSMISGTAKTEYMAWVLNKYAALACTQPVFLFFDDLDKAPPPIQGAMLRIIGNRSFRDRKLHPGTLIMCAGNRIGDDIYANEISESIRTRATIIEFVPDILSFSEYGVSTGDIHPSIVGYLQFKPEHLHQYAEAVNRFPTPRGWKEASQQFKLFNDPFEDYLGNGANDNWRGIIGRKLGDHVANDFWAWYTIVSKINVHDILTHGNMPAHGSDKDARMMQFAAVFAIAQHLNQKGVEKSHKGLLAFVNSLEPDKRVAFVIQLSRKARTTIASTFEDAADLMMSTIVSSSTGGSRFVK